MRDFFEAIIAAGNPFSGKNSSFHRSIRARLQPRDDEGRWIKTGAAFKNLMRGLNGTVYNVLSRSLGAAQGKNMIQIHITEGTPGIPAGIYEVPSDKGSADVQAIIGKDGEGMDSTMTGQSAPVYDGPDTNPNIINVADLKRVDAPDGWVLNEDGSYTTQDGKYTVKATGEGDNYSLSKNDELVGEYRDLGSAIAQSVRQDVEDNLDEPTKKRLAILREQPTLDPEAIDKLLFNDPETEGIDPTGTQNLNVPADEDATQVAELPADSKKSTSDGLKDPSKMTWDELNEELGWAIDGSPESLARFNKLNEEFYNRGGFQVPEADRDKTPAQLSPAAKTEAASFKRISEEAAKYKAAFEAHQKLDAAGFKVGDDTNHAFLDESPVGTKIKFNEEDPKDGSSQEMTATKQEDGSWKMEGGIEDLNGSYTSEDLKNYRDYYQIAEIPEVATSEAAKPVAELPARDRAEIRAELDTIDAEVARLNNALGRTSSDTAAERIDRQIADLEERRAAVQAELDQPEAPAATPTEAPADTIEEVVTPEVTAEPVAEIPTEKPKRRRGEAPLVARNDNEKLPATAAAQDPAPYVPQGTGIEGTSDSPAEIAELFNLTDLRNAYGRALINGQETISLSFPAQDGETIEAQIPIEAVRDAIQMLGNNTNVVAENVDLDARAPGQRVYDQSLLNLLSLLHTVENEHANLVASDPENQNIPVLQDRLRQLRNKVRDLQLRGARLPYDTQADPETIVYDLSRAQRRDGTAPDIYNPDLILEAMKKKYPDATVLPNGDILVGTNTVTDADGNQFTYDAIITRTDDNMFYTYIRETNHAEQDPEKKYRSVRFGAMRQSARALNNQAASAIKRVTNFGANWDISSWMNDVPRRRKEGIRFDSVDADGNPVHIQDNPLTKAALTKIANAVNSDEISDEMIRSVYNYIAAYGSSEEVFQSLRTMTGLDRDTMNQFVDAINSAIAKRDWIDTFRTWESRDGVPLSEGDEILYVGNSGEYGRRGRIRIRTLEHTSDDYSYTDYVYVQFEDANGNPVGNFTPIPANNLRLLQTAGGTDGSERVGPGAIFVPTPVLTTRANNRYAMHDRRGDIAPNVTEYNRDTLANPTVTINGETFPVNISRQLVISDALELQEANVDSVQQGDLIQVLNPDTGAAELSEVTRVVKNDDGSVTVYQAVPINISSARVWATTYGADEEGPTFAVYRENMETTLPDTITRAHQARMSELISSVDRSKLSADTNARIDKILSVIDPADIGLNLREFEDTYREALLSQNAELAPVPKHVNEAVRLLDSAIRYLYDHESHAQAYHLEAVRDSGVLRSSELGDDQTVSGMVGRGTMRGRTRPIRPSTQQGQAAAPARTNGATDVTNFETGPFGADSGETSADNSVILDILQRGDYEAMVNIAKEYMEGKMFGAFILKNVRYAPAIYSGGLGFQADIVTPDGRKVGATHRELRIDGSGRLAVEHHLMKIERDSDKGKGFSSNFSKVSESFYKSVGVDHINIHTAWDGSYAWALAGYTWDPASPSGPTSRIVPRLEAALDAAKRSRRDKDAAAIEALLKRFNSFSFDDPNFPEPIEVAKLVSENPDIKLGRDIMGYSGWNGVKYLDPETDPRPTNRRDITSGFASTPEAGADTTASTSEGGIVNDTEWFGEQSEGTVVKVQSFGENSPSYYRSNASGMWDHIGGPRIDDNNADEIVEDWFADVINENSGTVSHITDQAEIDAAGEIAPTETVEVTNDTMKQAFRDGDIEMLDNAVIQELAGQYGEGFTLKNFTSEIYTPQYGGDTHYSFEFTIHDANGDKVGKVQRSIYLMPNGSFKVNHKYLSLEEEYRGKGFSSEFSAASEEFYRKFGVSRIELLTMWDGSYVWAQAGYTWAPKHKETSLGEVPQHLEDALQEALDSGRSSDAAMLRDVIDRLSSLEMSDPDFPTPNEIANLISEDQDKFPGREFGRGILTDSEWMGVKYLNNEENN